MSSQRLEQHYQKLLNLFPQREALTTLQTLADALFCSKRHMRTLIIRMQSAGWLTWHARPGRGHLAKLVLRYSQQELMLTKAERLLDLNDMRGVLTLLGDEKHHLAALLRGRLGFSVQDERQSLRVPYYRHLQNLYPGTALRRTEIHLIRQIFSGLTRIDERSGQVAPDVAHRWRRLDALHWRFYLRPGVLFHDGTSLTSRDVVASLTRSAQFALFSHLKSVRALGELSVMIELSQPDELLPQLLTDAAALILPADHPQRPDFASHPVGSGPYQVAENNEWHLLLTAFDRYFGFRSLLDEIDIITCLELAPSDQPSALLSSGMSDIEYVAAQSEQFTASAEDPVLERGGYFLLCDSRSPLWHNMAQRRWIRAQLAPEAIRQQMPEAIRSLWLPAASLLSDWSHPVGDGVALPPETQRLRLAYHQQHWELPMLLRACQQILAASGVEVDAIEMPYEAWAAGNGEADLWLGTVNFTVPEAWNVGAWLTGMPLLKTSISGGDEDLLAYWQQRWRAGTLSARQLTEIIVRDGWLQPLFHHWMRLQGPEQVQGMHFNNLGWFDFTSTWIEPA